MQAGSLADVALALYRKYRPAKFAEVVGQEHVTEPLSRAIEAGRINHAYLFSGPRGCGKTSSARILARSLNCELGPTPEPCGVCPSCVSLAPGGPGNIDVTELDAASHGGVDDTRELRDRAFFAPAESRYRVFIVDEAHMITTQGFNALLKIVEEPPEHLVFVFATTEPEKVLPTIRSRTHHYPFRLIPPSTLRKLLERICAEEGVTVAPAVYPLVIRAGGGSARDSLSVLDQLVAGAGREGVTYERAVALLGVTDVSLIDDVVDALAAGDRAAVFEAVDRLVEAGHDPRRFATDLLQRLRDLTLLQAVPEAVGRGLVEAADDEVARMVEQSGKLGAATLTRYGEILHTGLTEMRGATAPRLLLELLCARMLLPAATTEEPGLLERLERLERRSAIAASPPAPGEAGGAVPVGSGGVTYAPTPAGADPVAGQSGSAAARSGSESGSAQARPGPESGTSGPAKPAPPTAAVPTGAPAPTAAAPTAVPSGEGAPPGRTFDRPSGLPATSSQSEAPAAEPRAVAESGAAPPQGVVESAPQPAASAVGAADVRRVWQEIQEAVKQRKKRTAALLVSATVRAVENDTLVLSIGTAPLARLLSEQSNTDVIADALYAVLGVRWRVRCEHGDGSAPRPQEQRQGTRPGGAGPSGRAPQVTAAGPAPRGGSTDGPAADGRSPGGGPPAAGGQAMAGSSDARPAGVRPPIDAAGGASASSGAGGRSAPSGAGGASASSGARWLVRAVGCWWRVRLVGHRWLVHPVGCRWRGRPVGCRSLGRDGAAARRVPGSRGGCAAHGSAERSRRRCPAAAGAAR